MSHTPKEVERLCKIAREAGADVEYWDYGFSAGCRWPGFENALVIAEVYRSERDGYTGGKLITEELLKEWLESWRNGSVVTTSDHKL